MTPRKKTGAAILLFCFSALGTACNGSPGDGPHATVPTWTLIEELRIGSHDDPEQALTYAWPFNIALGSNGHLYIAQSQAGEIWQYDPAGRLVRTIGRKGDGPGEFSHLGVIGMLGDTLYASNFIPGRVSFFSLDGTHLSTSALVLEPRSEYESPTPPYLFLPDGSAVVSPGRGIDGIASGAARAVTILRIDRSGQPLDTLFSHSGPTDEVVIPLEGGGLLGLLLPFSDHPLMTIAEDGSRMAVLDRNAAEDAKGAEFRLSELTLSGDMLISIASAYRPIPVPREITDSLRADMIRRAMRAFGSQGAAERAVQAAVRLPKHYPPVTSLLYADDHSLWLAREDLPTQSRQWEVYREGSKIAHLDMSRRSEVLLVRAERLWAVERDEYDIPYVVRYRIRRSPN